MSKRIFIDTNIMLDFLGERKPFYDPIAKIATLAEKEKLTINMWYPVNHSYASKTEKVYKTAYNWKP